MKRLMNNEWILTSPYAVYNHRLSLFGCVPLIHQVSESGRQFSPVTAPESVFGNIWQLSKEVGKQYFRVTDK